MAEEKRLWNRNDCGLMFFVFLQYKNHHLIHL